MIFEITHLWLPMAPCNLPAASRTLVASLDGTTPKRESLLKMHLLSDRHFLHFPSKIQDAGIGDWIFDKGGDIYVGTHLRRGPSSLLFTPGSGYHQVCTSIDMKLVSEVV